MNDMSLRQGLVACAWFAACPNRADGTVWHPTLDYVPCCRDCAEKLSMTLRDADGKEWEL